MTFGNIEMGMGSVRALVGPHEGDHAGQIKSEGDDHQFVHQSDVFTDVRRSLGREIRQGFILLLDGIQFFQPFDATFDITNSTEIFIQFAPIFESQFSFETFGIFENEIDDAGAASKPLETSCSRLSFLTLQEHSFKDPTWVSFVWNWSVGTLPGNIGGIGARVSGITIARLPSALGSQLQGGEKGVGACGCSDDLIDRDAGTNVTA